MPKISQLPPEENPTPDDEFVMVDKALGITKKVTGNNISGAFGDESIGIEKIENLSTSLNVDGTLKSPIGIGKVPENGVLDVDGDIYANGDRLVGFNEMSIGATVTGDGGDRLYWRSLPPGMYWNDNNSLTNMPSTYGLITSQASTAGSATRILTYRTSLNDMYIAYAGVSGTLAWKKIG